MHAAKTELSKFLSLEEQWPAWYVTIGNSRFGICGRSVLQLYHMSHTVWSAFLATACPLV